MRKKLYYGSFLGLLIYFCLLFIHFLFHLRYHIQLLLEQKNQLGLYKMVVGIGESILLAVPLLYSLAMVIFLFSTRKQLNRVPLFCGLLLLLHIGILVSVSQGLLQADWIPQSPFFFTLIFILPLILFALFIGTACYPTLKKGFTKLQEHFASKE